MSGWMKTTRTRNIKSAATPCSRRTVISRTRVIFTSQNTSVTARFISVPAGRRAIIPRRTTEPLLTTDSVKGVVRSSYFYNPRVKDAANGNYLRRYQKSSQFDGHKFFGCDVITNIKPEFTAHLKDVGYSVLFTDGAAKFTKSQEAFTFVSQMRSFYGSGGSTFGTPVDLDHVFDLLEK